MRDPNFDNLHDTLPITDPPTEGTAERTGAPARPAEEAGSDADFVSRMVSDMESRLAKVRDMSASLSKREVDAARRDAEITKRAQELEARQKELAEKEQSLRQRAEEAKAEIRRLEQAAQAVAEQGQTLAERERALEGREATIVSREHQAEARDEALTDIRSGLVSKERLLAEAQERVKELEARMSEREAELTAKVRSLEAAARSAEQRVREVEEREQALAATASQIKEQQAIIQEAKSASIAERDKALAEREKELSAMRMSLEAQRERLEEAAKAIEAEKAEIRDGRAPALTQGVNSRLVEEKEAELEKARDAVEADRQRMAALAEQLRKEREELARERGMVEMDRDRGAAMKAMSVAIDEALAACKARRERLRRVREALRERWIRVEKAKEAIRERARECEKILAQREQLTRAQREVEDRSREVELRAGKTRASAATLRFVVTIAILGALSFVTAGYVAPATYVLNATLTADAQTLGENPEAREEWSATALNLARDPRLIQEAADRLKRRGMADLGAAPALGAHLEGAMDISPNGPGSMNVSVTDNDLGRAQRLMETYLASFVALANDARTRRPDAPATLVAEHPGANPAPINDQRVVYAAAMWGASSLLAMIIGWALWARLARAQASSAPGATTLSAA